MSGEFNASAAEVDFSTTGNGSITRRNEDLARTEIGVLAALFSAAVLGNGAVIAVLWCSGRRKDLNHMETMTAHLACADLSVAFFNVLPQLFWDITETFRGGDLLCRLVKYAQVAAMYSSSYVLLTTAIDRYLAICHPLRCAIFRTQRMHVMVCVAWLVSLIFSTPQLFFFSASVKHGAYSCWSSFSSALVVRLYVTWVSLAIYVIPSLLLIVLYLRVYSVVRSRVKSKGMMISSAFSRLWTRTCSESSDDVTPFKLKCRRGDLTRSTLSKRTPISEAKVRTALYTGAVIASYLVCWGPYFCVTLWSQWDTSAPVEGKCPVTVPRGG